MAEAVTLVGGPGALPREGFLKNEENMNAF